MNKTELHKTIAQGEGYYTEFKRNLNTDLAKELVAFANASGGNILLGVEDNGHISGVNSNNEFLSKVQSVANSCDPPVHVKLKAFENVLLIQVDEGTHKPYRCSKGFFLRIGPNAEKLKTDQIVEFIENEGRIRFDEQIRKDVDFTTQFSNENWERFTSYANIPVSVNPEFTLQSIGVLKVHAGKNYFTNAGLLVFAKNVNTYLPQATITCVAFSGTDKVNILDQKEQDADVVTCIDGAMQFIERHINVSAQIEGVQRKNVWEIPQVAIREALINAVVHRDYLVKGARVMVEIYTDKIIISNPGGLPNGLHEKDFGKYSLTRNSVLASLLLRIGYIEKLGTGINRINELLTLANLPHASFEFGSFFSVTIQKQPKAAIPLKQGVIKKGKQKLSFSLSNNQLRILDLIRKKPTITQKEMAEVIEVYESTVERNIKKLVELGMLRREGSKKDGNWIILK